MDITCIGCKNILSIENFYKHKASSTGVLHRCKTCVKKQRVKKHRENRLNPKFVAKEKRRQKEKYIRLGYAEKSRERMKNPMRRLMHRYRCMVHNLCRDKSSSEVLGCSYKQFKNYIESKFQPGMSWDNMGEWHLDHVMPLSWCETPEELFIYSHYSNLYPLWADQNISKSNKYIGLPNEIIIKTF